MDTYIRHVIKEQMHDFLKEQEQMYKQDANHRRTQAQQQVMRPLASTDDTMSRCASDQEVHYLMTEFLAILTVRYMYRQTDKAEKRVVTTVNDLLAQFDKLLAPIHAKPLSYALHIGSTHYDDRMRNMVISTLIKILMDDAVVKDATKPQSAAIPHVLADCDSHANSTTTTYTPPPYANNDSTEYVLPYEYRADREMFFLFHLFYSWPFVKRFVRACAMIRFNPLFHRDVLAKLDTDPITRYDYEATYVMQVIHDWIQKYEQGHSMLKVIRDYQLDALIHLCFDAICDQHPLILYMKKLARSVTDLQSLWSAFVYQPDPHWISIVKNHLFHAITAFRKLRSKSIVTSSLQLHRHRETNSPFTLRSIHPDNSAAHPITPPASPSCVTASSNMNDQDNHPITLSTIQSSRPIMTQHPSDSPQHIMTSSNSVAPMQNDNRTSSNPSLQNDGSTMNGDDEPNSACIPNSPTISIHPTMTNTDTTSIVMVTDDEEVTTIPCPTNASIHQVRILIDPASLRNNNTHQPLVLQLNTSTSHETLRGSSRSKRSSGRRKAKKSGNDDTAHYGDDFSDLATVLENWKTQLKEEPGVADIEEPDDEEMCTWTMYNVKQAFTKYRRKQRRISMYDKRLPTDLATSFGVAKIMAFVYDFFQKFMSTPEGREYHGGYASKARFKVFTEDYGKYGMPYGSSAYTYVRLWKKLGPYRKLRRLDRSFSTLYKHAGAIADYLEWHPEEAAFWKEP